MEKLLDTQEHVSPCSKRNANWARAMASSAMLMLATHATAEIDYGTEMTLKQSCEREGGEWTGSSCEARRWGNDEGYSDTGPSPVATGIGLIIISGLICAVTDCLSEDE